MDVFESPDTRSAIRDQAGQPLRILVAEDNAVNQLVLKAVLDKFGHHADIVDDGTKAVAAVLRKPYDLVLMDLQMPVMDGLTATRRIRELPGPVNQIPIIALTANNMVGDREECLEAGMNDHLAKPIDNRVLQAILARFRPMQEIAFVPDGDQEPLAATHARH